jgi:pimeloyl-ACP methyl ester carboxylesterase
MGNLEVDGAQLYYEIRGAGPLLLMIPVASGSTDAYNGVADFLAPHLTVVTYDRRGFSRSQLNSPQDDTQRLGTDADDAARLLKRLSPAPATIFGSSSGAIVALELLARHPSLVSSVVAHEPPLVKLLADGQYWIKVFLGLYQQYLESGPQHAMQEFRDQILTASDRLALARAMDGTGGTYAIANAKYWFEHELRQYPAVDLDLGTLELLGDCIAPAVGRDSAGFPAHQATEEFAKRLGRQVTIMPGGHLGFLSESVEFGDSLLHCLGI